MALNVDKSRQLAGYTSTPTAQPKAAKSDASSQPIDFSNKNNNYQVKKGDNLWNVAKNLLLAAGKTSPTNAEIIQVMNKIAAANGCSTPDECRIKCFSRIGTELIIPVLVETKVNTDTVDEETPTEPEQPVITEQETKIKEVLKTKFPDLALENMTDSELKAFLAKLKETNPDLLSVLEASVSAPVNEEITPTAGVEESQVPTAGLTEEQTQELQEQLNQYIFEKPKVVTEHTTSPQQTVAQSEMEQLAQKIGMENENIEDIICCLRSKRRQGDELSADEARLIELYDKNTEAEKENLVSREKEQKLSKRDLVVDYSEFLSEKFMNMSPEERLSYFTDKYLSKNDSNYSNLTPQQQKDYVSKTLSELMKNLNNGQVPKTKEERAKVGIKAIAFMQTAHANHLSLEELAKSPKREDMVEKTIQDVINDVINIVDKEEIKGKTNIDIAHAYMSKILTLTDSEYNKITNQDDKKAYELKKIAEMVSKYTGIDIDINIPGGREKLEAGIDETLSVFKYVLENNKGDNKISITKLLNGQIPKLDFEEGYYNWLKTQPDSASKTQNTAQSEARRQVYQRLRDKGIENPTNGNILEELETMRKEQGGKLKDEYLEEMYNTLKRASADGRVDIISIEDSANMKAASAAGKELDVYFNSQFEDLKTKQEKLDKLGELIAGCNGDPQEIIKLREAALKAGFTEEEFKNNLATYGGDKGELLEQAYYKAMKAEEFNSIKHLDINKERIASRVEVAQQWFQDDIKNLTEIDADVIQNTPEYIDSMTVGMHKYGTKESNTALWKSIAESGNVADANLAQGVDNFMKNAPSDEVRLSYSESLSNMDNAAVLEGVAAGSKYVSDSGIKQQYNSTVTTAAKKYPPETQSNINYAMETGNVSPSTKAKTTPPASYNSGSDYSYQTTTQTANASTTQYTTTSSPKYGTTIGLSQVDISNIAAASEAKRQAAMDNARETAQSIEEAVDNWNKKHTRKLSVDDIDAVKAAAAVEAAREAVESSATSESEKERILNALANATSVGEIYDILVGALGASKVQDKFIEILASSGSTSNIKAFVASRAGDSDSLVRRLFLRTSSSSLKKELLGMMSSDTVAELLANNQISDLTAVDQRILISYVMKNIHLMSNTEFARFLNAIADPVEKERLIAIRTGVSRLKSRKQQDQQVQADKTTVETAQTGDAPTVQPAPQTFSSAQQSNAQPQVAPEETDAQSQSKLAKGEMSKDMGDGTILTREGAGFGAISNTDFDLTRIIQNPKHKDGAPIGMQDETLTVGSAEWNKKYNKNNVQSTAFTLAALEEYDDAFGGAWFGNKGNFKGKKIDKKSGLRFNA